MPWQKIRSYLLAASYDLLLRNTERRCLRSWRQEILAHARGDVLEIGAGTGLNLPFYPAAVKQLYLAEPDQHMRQKLATKVNRLADKRTRIAAWRAEAIDLPDHSCDTIVSTLVLCSISSLEAGLDEVKRLLRPGGKLLFLEHIISDHPPTRALQQRFEPLWSLCAGDCRLTRDTAEAISTAGLHVEQLTEERMLGAPGLINRTVRGWASKSC
jgi:ubiquinone/menaquinone biosynthesis C-methylase UbiE